MCRFSAILCALSCVFCANAIGLGESQAGEPMTVNVEYTVPAYGAKDVQSLAQRGVASSTKLHAKSVLSSRVPLAEAPFAALSEGRGARGKSSSDTIVTVHVPSPAGVETTLVANARADAAVLGQLAEAQDKQEQRFLHEVGKVTTQLRTQGGF